MCIEADSAFSDELLDLSVRTADLTDQRQHCSETKAIKWVHWANLNQRVAFIDSETRNVLPGVRSGLPLRRRCQRHAGLALVHRLSVVMCCALMACMAQAGFA